MHARKIIPSLLICINLVMQASAQWTPLNSGTQRHLHDVFFIDEQTGWVVGDHGFIQKTTDGGASWIAQTADSIHLMSVAFLDADTGYVLPEFSAPWFTYDGGNTWTHDAVLDGSCIGVNIAFNDRLLYLTYGGCFGGAWLYTLDPATHDTTQLFEWWPSPQYQGFMDFGFPGPGTAVTMGADHMMAHTFDAGDTWAVTPPTDTTMDWVALDFVSPTQGYAVERDQLLPLYLTTDGGQTWVLDSSWLSSFYYPTPMDVDYRDPGYGFIATDVQWSTQGLIIEMKPGTPWSNYVTLPNVPRAIHMVTDSVGYVVGDSGMIWKRTGGPLAVEASAATVDFQISPNPAEDRAMVFLGGQAAGTLRIYHADGRLIREMEVQPGMTSLELEGMAGGVHLLRLEHSRGVAIKRLVLTR